VYKKGDKFDCTNYQSVERCIQSLRQSITRLFVTLRRRGRSALPSWVPVRQINDEGNEYNIQTHQPLIDFKTAYDTIIQNDVYVSILELNFPTKLIRLTAATLKPGKY
jgi:hypothetical protein